MRCWPSLAAVASLLAAGAALAQEPVGVATRGKEMALELCTECHFVAADQTALRGVNGPSFYDLSEDSAVTEFSLRVFLTQTPHPVMPNFIFTDQEADDLAAYILGLSE
jgi:mono/diheme cytochrome c family protein